MSLTSDAVFGALSKEDKLDGTNYSLWSFMVCNILISRDLWSFVSGDELRPGNVAPATPGRAPLIHPPLTAEQKRWDSRDALALSAISLTCKRSIIPHIKSCKHAQQAWDTLEALYAAKNDTRIAYLKKEMEQKMDEGSSMNEHLTRVQDLREQLADIDEIIPDKDMISITLNTLPPSYLHFQTSLRLSLRSSNEPLKFTELVALLLQEEQARECATNSSHDQAYSAKYKNKGKKQSNSKKAPASKSSSSSSSQPSNSNKKKDSTFCRYCKANDHVIDNCPKLKAKEAKGKKKESNKSSSNVVADSKANESANFVQHIPQDCSLMAVCSIDPSEQDSCLASTSQHVWFMDSGASKHITSIKSLIKDMKLADEGHTVSCANNALLPVKGVGSITLTTVNGEPLHLHNCLYVPGIKKNLLSVPTLARGGYHVAFEDDKCVVRDKRKWDAHCLDRFSYS